MCFHLRQTLFRCILPLIAWATIQPTSGDTPNPPGPVILMNAAQVRALPPAEAAKKIPVRLRGVVVENDKGGSFTIVDDTAGMFVSSSAGVASGFENHDLIEMEGVTNPGKFAPYLDAQSVRKLGPGKLPEPRVASRDELISGQLDAQWIELSGVVRRAEPRSHGLNLEVDLENGGGRMLVRVSEGDKLRITVDSTVRLRGVCYYQFNNSRQVLRPFMSVPAGEPVVVKEPATTDVFSLPVRAIESLMQFSSGQSNVHRVRVRGAVIHSQPGEGLWIRDGGRALHVLCNAKDLLENGAEVDVFGFLGRGEYGPMLEDAIFQKRGKTTPVPPIHLENAAAALDHDSDLVECEAVIREKWLAADGCRLKLSDGATEFLAVIRTTNLATPSKEWLPGTQVRIAGVCSVGFLTKPLIPGELEPQHFQILLRSPADILVIQPPSWWTSRNMAWLFGTAAAVLLLVVGIIVWIGRRHLREQAIERMKTEAEFSAVMNERSRMAREFHDTLAQGLGAISLQLEVAKRQLPADSDAQEPLGEAGLQTRASLDEVRNAIWNMRSQVLETGDLAFALNGILHSLADRNHLQSELRIVGESRRFAPVVENNLLRIGQEAIANAVKHAGAKRIEVVLKFEERQFGLSVSDDGRGFDLSHPPTSEGGFGLIAMRERAKELNGELDIRTTPGKGCIIKLTMPLPASSLLVS
jgi:signal transduction histidine kinase